LYFLFSSRRRHTRFSRDWSSDVCSSDLLGTTEKKRSSAAPDIPALAETPGFEDVDINVWFGLYGPAGMPEAVVTRLRTALGEALKSDVLREKLAASGASLYGPEVDPVQFYASEKDKFKQLVDLAGIGRSN